MIIVINIRQMLRGRIIKMKTEAEIKEYIKKEIKWCKDVVSSREAPELTYELRILGGQAALQAVLEFIEGEK